MSKSPMFIQEITPKSIITLKSLPLSLSLSLTHHTQTQGTYLKLNGSRGFHARAFDTMDSTTCSRAHKQQEAFIGDDTTEADCTPPRKRVENNISFKNRGLKVKWRHFHPQLALRMGASKVKELGIEGKRVETTCLADGRIGAYVI